MRWWLERDERWTSLERVRSLRESSVDIMGDISLFGGYESQKGRGWIVIRVEEDEEEDEDETRAGLVWVRARVELLK